MLSLANTSDPSCSSSRVSGFRADERDSGQLPLQEADPVIRFGEALTSNFSIRDHVFALRNKSIGKSWPFPSQLLQLCLKNGIRDLLPPFEPPNSVRAHCFIRSVSEAQKLTVSSSKLGETFQHEGEANSTRTDQLCLSSDQQDLLRCSDKVQVHSLREQDKYDHNLVNDVCEIGSTVTNHCDIDIFSAPIGEPAVLIIPETSLAEEYSTTSTASDIMASKVCPVCKAFSSTSNTTLNAHMDQCLSMESDATLAVDKLPKLRVKPRKKRLMEDIYATAPISTLEDLDRRNGSTWATDLSVVAALSAEAANSEPKKPKLSQLEPRDDKNEGAVYVDSNGIKLRILSKFNDAPPQALTREEFWPRRNIKSVQDGKIVLIKKKNHFTSTCSKKIKLKLRNKKLSSLKLFENEVQVEPEVVHHEESHLVDEASPVQLSGEADQSLSCGSATLKNWPSSKRSDLAKKVCKKDFHKILEHTKLDSRIEMLASDTPSASKSHFGRLSQLLESKTVNLPANTVRNKENKEKSSQRWPSEGNSANVLPKLSRVPAEALVSAPRSNSEEFYMGRKQKSHTHLKTKKRSADHTYHLPLKTKRVSTLSGLSTSTIKFRKHQSSLSRTDRRIGEVSYVSNPRHHRSVKAVLSGQDEELITNQNSHPASSTQCQDTQTRISDMQVDQKMDLDALEKDDASCIIPNPLVSQDRDRQRDTNVKTNLKMPIQEHEMPVAQPLLEQEKLVNIGVESQAEGTSAQESSAFLTNPGDLEIDIPRANSTTALGALAPNKEIKLVISCREPSISPASSASTISPSSPNDYHSKASVLSTTQGKLSTFPLPLMLRSEGSTQEIDMDGNQLLELDSTVKKLHQLCDYHPCCCSWQSIMAGSNMPPTKPKPLPNLHIKPSISSFHAYSSLKSDTANTPSLESPTESILTRACSDVGSTSPSSGTPTQSSSNSILRLMGKDLMVVNNEESAHFSKALLQATDNNSTVQTLPSPLGFASFASISKPDAFSFAVCNQSPSITSSSQARNCLPSFHQRNMNHKDYATKEVIVIDDSDDGFAPRDTSSNVPVSHAMFQRPFTYFPQHSHLLPKDNGVWLSNPTNQGSSVPAPHLPRPFVFQSPSANHLNSPFYHPQSLR